MTADIPIVPVELDELEDAAIATLLLLESTLASSDAELTASALNAASTVAKLLPGDHPVRERVLGCLDALRGGQTPTSSDAAHNDLLNLASELNDIGEARLPD